MYRNVQKIYIENRQNSLENVCATSTFSWQMIQVILNMWVGVPNLYQATKAMDQFCVFICRGVTKFVSSQKPIDQFYVFVGMGGVPNSGFIQQICEEKKQKITGKKHFLN